jgi:hypothetical protein
VGYFATGFLVRTKPFTPKKKPKKDVDYFWKHQKNISDYDKVFENSISFRKKDLLRIKILEYRAIRAFLQAFGTLYLGTEAASLVGLQIP